MANKKDTKLPVPGFEALVRSLREKLNTLKWMTAEVDTAKEAFRTHAKQAAANAPAGVTSLEYVDPDGGNSILVSLPDPTKAGNRLNLKPELLAEMQQNGIAVEQCIETEESYKLTGPYVVWFKGLLQQWEQQGVVMPEDGLEHTVVTRLSEAGVTKLREIAAAGGALAAGFLDKALKAATVR